MRKASLFLAAVGLLTFALSGSALAFHSGGVAHCDGCHTMHNSNDGASVLPGGSVGTGINSFLTTGSDPSSTCLNCHQGSGSYHMFSTDDAA